MTAYDLNWYNIILIAVNACALIFCIALVNYGKNTTASDFSLKAASLAFDADNFEQARVILIQHLLGAPQDIEARLFLERVLSCQFRSLQYSPSDARKQDHVSHKKNETHNNKTLNSAMDRKAA